MPTMLTYPGVYVEEVPSAIRTISGVATSITAFLGRAARGPVNDPTKVLNFADYERMFGGLWALSTMSYAVRHFFLNGGREAIIVRLVNSGARALFKLDLTVGTVKLNLNAANDGTWGNNLKLTVDWNTRPPRTGEADKLFNLTVNEVDPATTKTVRSETHRNVSIDPAAPRFVTKVLKENSDLIRVADPHPGTFPSQRPSEVTDKVVEAANQGSDGNQLTQTEYAGSADPDKTGLNALDKVDLFNLLVISPIARGVDIPNAFWDSALAYCVKRRAMLLVDSPSGWTNVSAAAQGVSSTPPAIVLTEKKNAALFFPRIKAPDPLNEDAIEEFAPGGAVAGIVSRSDAAGGVWVAPAGQDAGLVGVPDLTVRLTDDENGQLNPLGVNCLRSLPLIGNVVWGARTVDGADRLASEWKYIPVRRMALFLEESLYRGLAWTIFEPNDEPLWSQIRLSTGSFLHSLFRQGAFQGKSPREAYFVKCDKETTTADDVSRGVVNVLVGFAALRPAEFVVIKLSQLAGQVQT